MQPKRKKRSKSTQKQNQSQKQSVVVNLNSSKYKPRKKSGRGGLPPPSYAHNLAPTFVMQQATDFNPVIGAVQSLTAKLNEQSRIQQPVTPLSSAVQSTQTSPVQSVEQLAGEAALRRAGRTASNFQSPPSQADERLYMSLEDRPQPAENIEPLPNLSEKLMTKAAQIISLQKAKQVAAGTALRRAEQLAGKNIAASGGGGIPEAVGFIKRGRPFAQATEAIPVNQTYLIAQPAAAEEPTLESTAEQKAKPLPSQTDKKMAQQTQDEFDVEDEQAFQQKILSGSGQASVSVSSGGGQKILGGGQYPSLGKIAPKSEESKQRDANLDAQIEADEKRKAEASKQQAALYKSIKDKIDKNIELTADEIVKVQTQTGKEKIGKKRNKKFEKKYGERPDQ